MGFNTTVVILNDGLHDIAKDTEFSKKLADAVARLSVTEGKAVDVSAGCFANPCVVVETHHADGVCLIAVGGNYGRNLGHVASWSQLSDDVALLRGLADKLGYRIVRKGKRK